MGHKFADLTFTDNVKVAQESNGSRQSCARMQEGATHHDVLGPREVAFITARDSFYMASVSETGWPYIQHRGGKPGFVRVLDGSTIGFPDFSGNRQYISVGNLQAEDRVALFMMDYAHRTRLKILGRAHLVELDDEETMTKLSVPDNSARVERGFVVKVEAFDWNCPQHITQRFTLAEIETATAPLHARIAELEQQILNRTTRT